MVWCCVKGCKSTSKKKQQGVSFHSIPISNASHWCRILKVNVESMKHKKVCCLHFEDNCFDRTGQTVRLRQNVIPTLLLSKMIPCDAESSSKSPCPPDSFSGVQSSDAEQELNQIIMQPCSSHSSNERPRITFNVNTPQLVAADDLNSSGTSSQSSLGAVKRQSSSSSVSQRETAKSRKFSISAHNYCRSPSEKRLQETLREKRIYQNRYYYNKKEVGKLRQKVKCLTALAQELQNQHYISESAVSKFVQLPLTKLR